MKELSSFEGKVEVSARMQIAGVNDRLKTPLSALPRAWESGERIPVLIWVEVDKLRHDPLPGVGWVRVHLTNAEEAIVLDHVEQSLLDELAEAQRHAVAAWELEQQRLKAEARGEVEIPFESNGESDEDWEASAKATAPASLGSKRPRKTKEVAE